MSHNCAFANRELRLANRVCLQAPQLSTALSIACDSDIRRFVPHMSWKLTAVDYAASMLLQGRTFGRMLMLRQVKKHELNTEVAFIEILA